MKNLCRGALAALTTVAFMAALSGVASADTSSQLTVVGTSDVNDSGLIPNLIEPEFHAQYPQYTFKYTGSATGTAIQNAENGVGTPSVLIVHAASLENQFVAGGYSYNNQPGNAIFTNDFVLAGPATGSVVPAADTHNVAQAFADVARAGVAGTATFISRGGAATASGTTVEEHTLWQLMYTSGLTPAGVVLCNVSAADGGGMTPINPSTQPTSGQACPTADGGIATGADLPTWYTINTGASQGLNVVTTNACTAMPSGPNSCYSLTDRGTFLYLQTGNSPNGTAGTSPGTNEIPNLAITARDNAATSPGGADELINYFHAYVINPNAANEAVNLPAAQAFVAFLTSPAFQAQLKTYLDYTTDPGGAPFHADASPVITATGLPTSAAPGKTVTVSGSVTNAEPGYPALASQTVSVDETVAGVPVAVASGTTNASGNYSVTFVPPSSGSYQVETGQITELVNPTLTPTYSDILSPAASTATTISLGASVTITKYTTSTSGVSVSGALGLATPDANASVTVLARKQGSTGSYQTVGTEALAKGAKTYALNGALSWGKWQIKVSYQDAGQFATANSGTRNITVPVKSQTVKYKTVTVTKGKIKLTGTLNQGPVSTKATVTLMALQAGKLAFTKVGTASVGTGKTTYTITGKLASGHSYALQLKYTHSGQATAYSKLRTIKVK
jgi:tungstate transport system substrate-binding protein